MSAAEARIEALWDALRVTAMQRDRAAVAETERDNVRAHLDSALSTGKRLFEAERARADAAELMLSEYRDASDKDVNRLLARAEAAEARIAAALDLLGSPIDHHERAIIRALTGDPS